MPATGSSSAWQRRARPEAPLDEAAKVLLGAAADFLKKHDCARCVVFCLFSEAELELFRARLAEPA